MCIDGFTDCLEGSILGKNSPMRPRDRSLHSRQFLTAHVHTSRKHCLKIPPLDMFFSASSSAKLRLEAKTKTSAMASSL